MRLRLDFEFLLAGKLEQRNLIGGLDTATLVDSRFRGKDNEQDTIAGRITRGTSKKHPSF